MISSTPPVATDGVVSGSALVCSGLFPWVRSGPGSSLNGMELAAAFRNGAGLPDWAPRVALAIIAVALTGVLHLATSMTTRPFGRRVRLASGVAIVLALAVTARYLDLDRWGTGLMFAAAGALLSTVVGTLGEVRALRKGRMA